MFICPIRNDSRGAGHFNAKRGNRRHKGLDIAVYPNSYLVSPENGILTRVNRAYSNENKAEYKILDLKVSASTTVRFFYVLPLLDIPLSVKKGDIIAKVQNIQKSYKPSMLNHVHVGLKINGIYVDPYPWLKERNWVVPR